MSWIQMTDTAGGLEVNFYDFPALGRRLRVTTICDGLDRTVPHTIKVTIDFVDGATNDVVEVYVDGTLVHTGTTWEDYFRLYDDAQVYGTRTVDSILFRTGGAPAPPRSARDS